MSVMRRKKLLAQTLVAAVDNMNDQLIAGAVEALGRDQADGTTLLHPDTGLPADEDYRLAKAQERLSLALDVYWSATSNFLSDMRTKMGETAADTYINSALTEFASTSLVELKSDAQAMRTAGLSARAKLDLGTSMLSEAAHDLLAAVPELYMVRRRWILTASL